MEQIKPKTAEYLYYTYFSLVVFKNGTLIAEGTLHSCPKIKELLQDSECNFFVRKNKKKRFTAYLQGKILIGSFLNISFGLIFLAFLGLSFIVPLKSLPLMLPFLFISGGTSLFGFYLAKLSLRRLRKTLRRHRP